jgi:hypothetical protein
MTELVVNNLQTQQHLLYTTLDYLQLPWLYARPARICFGIKAQSDRLIAAGADVKLQLAGKAMTWSVCYPVMLAPIHIEKTFYSMRDNTFSIIIRSQSSFSDYAHDLKLYCTDKDTYMRASWLLATKCISATVVAAGVSLGSVYPCLKYIATHERAVLDGFINHFFTPGYVAIELSGFAKILWPSSCNEIEIQFKLNRNCVWPGGASADNIYLQILHVENITTVTSDPWASVKDCNTYFLASPDECSVQSVSAIAGHNYQETLRWHSHGLGKDMSFYAYPLSERNGWALELDPIPNHGLALTADVNIMHCLDPAVRSATYIANDLAATFCGFSEPQPRCTNLARQLAWHNTYPNDLHSLQIYLSLICVAPVLKALSQSVSSFACQVVYAHKDSGLEKIINSKLHMQDTGFAEEEIYFFCFFLQQSLRQRFRCQFILVVQTDEYARMVFD